MEWEEYLDLDKAFAMDDQDFYGRFPGLGRSTGQQPQQRRNDPPAVPVASTSRSVPPGRIDLGTLNLQRRPNGQFISDEGIVIQPGARGGGGAAISVENGTEVLQGLSSQYPDRMQQFLASQGLLNENWHIPREDPAPLAPQPPPPPQAQGEAKKTKSTQDLEAPAPPKKQKTAPAEAKKKRPQTPKPKPVPIFPKAEANDEKPQVPALASQEVPVQELSIPTDATEPYKGKTSARTRTTSLARAIPKTAATTAPKPPESGSPGPSAAALCDTNLPKMESLNAHERHMHFRVSLGLRPLGGTGRSLGG